MCAQWGVQSWDVFLRGRPRSSQGVDCMHMDEEEREETETSQEYEDFKLRSCDPVDEASRARAAGNEDKANAIEAVLRPPVSKKAANTSGYWFSRIAASRSSAAASISTSSSVRWRVLAALGLRYRPETGL